MLDNFRNAVESKKENRLVKKLSRKGLKIEEAKGFLQKQLITKFGQCNAMRIACLILGTLSTYLFMHYYGTLFNLLFIQKKRERSELLCSILTLRKFENYSKCQNEFLNFVIFHQFCLIKIELSGNTL